MDDQTSGKPARSRLPAAVLAVLVAAASLLLLSRAIERPSRQLDTVGEGRVGNGQIAFASDGITLVNPDGTGLQQLHQSLGSRIDTGPVWSPDGTRLAYAHKVDEYQLRILDPATGSIVDPIGEEADAAYGYTWSPDGTRIAFNHGNGVFLIDADGTGVTRLADGGHPAWSPDGTRIAFLGDGGLNVVNVDGSGQTTLARGTVPAWSPSGTKIAFVDYVDLQISVVNPDGTGLMQLTRLQSVEDIGQPAWSPDGSRIAFEVKQGGDCDIYAVNADGAGLTSLTGEPGDENIPTWSPDATKIAFIAGKAVEENPGNTLTFDVYVMDPDGTNKTRLTEGAAPAYALSWQVLQSSSAA